MLILFHLQPPPTEETHLTQLENDLLTLLDRVENIQGVLKILRKENEAFSHKHTETSDAQDSEEGWLHGWFESKNA